MKKRIYYEVTCDGPVWWCTLHGWVLNGECPSTGKNTERFHMHSSHSKVVGTKRQALRLCRAAAQLVSPDVKISVLMVEKTKSHRYLRDFTYTERR